MANKIQKLLSVSGNELYAKRGEIAARQLQNAVVLKKTKINQNLDSLDMEESKLLDLGKTDENSLLPNSPQDADKFIDNLIQIDIKRQSLTIEKKAVDRIISEYFTDEEEPKAPAEVKSL